MIHQIWRLSEAGADNLGLASTEDGLLLARTPLIERRGGRFIVRERSEIERLLNYAYCYDFPVDRLMGGLATVASALEAGDQCLARIAAVHLRLPDVPSRAARDLMEAEDSLIKSATSLPPPGHCELTELRKASPDDPNHPGWPAGTEGGLGGKFRPKDGSQAALTQEIRDRITRHE